MLTNPLVDVAEKTNQAAFQEAIEAIHSHRYGLAHRLLLKAFQADPQDVQTCLLLSWTAPTQTSTTNYFHHLLELHPNNPFPMKYYS
jgi:lipoprotein NlpI